MISLASACGNTLGLYFAAPPHRFKRKTNFSAMRSPFYQGNFCSECGNPLQQRFQLRPRHFCDECATRLRQRSYVSPLAILLLAASVAVFAFSYKTGNSPTRTDHSAVPISAEDTIVNRSLKPAVAVEPKTLCGARTRRGTPCRRPVKPGQRCAQHQGRPSMLAERTTSQR